MSSLLVGTRSIRIVRSPRSQGCPVQGILYSTHAPPAFGIPPPSSFPSEARHVRAIRALVRAAAVRCESMADARANHPRRRLARMARTDRHGLHRRKKPAADLERQERRARTVEDAPARRRQEEPRILQPRLV